MPHGEIRLYSRHSDSAVRGRWRRKLVAAGGSERRRNQAEATLLPEKKVPEGLPSSTSTPSIASIP
jgi:hypothetical protein